MKKITTIFLFFFGFIFLAHSQNYGVGNSIGTSEPYQYNSPGTTVLAVPSNEVLSSTQTLPFTWNFYGAPVTSYKVSDNGYITFNAAATVSNPNNLAIPSVLQPNNAIYAFWDDLNIAAGSGSVDAVYSFNYGTAPNRTHVIQWFSVTPTSGTGFLYAAIRIHECGDFDIVHNYGNATGLTATVGCEDASGLIGAMPQGPSYDYPATGSDGADDIVYTFYWGGINYDVEVSTTDFGAFANIGNNPISGEFINNGAQAITSYDLNYSVDAGPAITMSVNGVNIPAYGGVGNYNHSTPLNIANGGESHDVCIWIDNINGNMDQRTCNDILCENIFSNNGTSASEINVVVEEFTGSWCGWCPDSKVILSNISVSNPSNVIVISVHDGDGMEYAEGIRSEFGVSAYPNGMIDRKVFNGEPDEPHSRGSWANNVNIQLAKYTPVEVDLALLYNPTTRTIDATVTANFVDYAAGDMRFILAITENNVTGSGVGYDQVNYLNTTAGHPYEGAGDPIVGFNHTNVLRANLPGVYGNAGVIPSPVSPASSYSETFSYVVPANFDENQISVTGLVSYSDPVIGGREILNAKRKHLSTATLSVADESIASSLLITPNPADDEFSVIWNSQKPIIADIILYNVYGQEVKKIASQQTMQQGNSSIKANVSNLSNGIYFVTIRTKEHTITKKLIVK
ncbi:MAG: T9SS type A sorting domain-containing protein [Oceanihabitans sp.]